MQTSLVRVLAVAVVAVMSGVVACSSSTDDDELGTSEDAVTSVGDAMCESTAKTGDYCGGDKVSRGDGHVLYTCHGPGKPTSAKKCAAGCAVNPGEDDTCKARAKSYHLPWSKGTTMHLTQDCDDSCCSDHVGSDEYAYDWANGSSFVVRAARAGTISHLKINSTKGCATTACSVDVNMLVIDHGRNAGHLHAPRRRQREGGHHVWRACRAGPSARDVRYDWPLHRRTPAFSGQPEAPERAPCECGANGKECATTYNPLPDTWVNDGYHTVPVTFAEWPTSASCNNRRITMPRSLSD